MSIKSIESWLRAERIAFVCVHEARRAMLPDRCMYPPASPDGDELCIFHFVMYQDPPNWLVFVGSRSDERVRSMRAWEVFFGEGFVAVFARWCKAANGPVFRDLNGEAMTIAVKPVSASAISAIHSMTPSVPVSGVLHSASSSPTKHLAESEPRSTDAPTAAPVSEPEPSLFSQLDPEPPRGVVPTRMIDPARGSR